MTLVGDEYRELIAEHLSPRSPKIPFYSSVRSKVLHEASDFGPTYWQDNLQSPVLFHSATKALSCRVERMCRASGSWTPCSSQWSLEADYKESSEETNYLSTLIRGKDDTVSFLQPVGQLHSLGVKISYPARP